MEMDKTDFSCQYDHEKHSYFFDNGSDEFQLRLPITIKISPEGIVSESEVKYLMLLVQTGSASIGVFQGEKCLEHKVFTAYMVRKKQGVSQIKHLKTKGKSRAGSRVRLAKTLLFFEDINERLTRHFKENEFDRIAFSCSKILMPYLFGSKVTTPFERKDERIYKIPKHLHQPNFEVMLGMQRFLNKGELIYDAKSFPEVESSLNHL
ncbi:hypothetical protein J4E76_05230 [Fabibacter sp. E12]|nr:hypothetical protein [Roseivirga sp. E12]MBO3697841.1 hypothetical protein [Roseivirga sp. E12]